MSEAALSSTGTALPQAISKELLACVSRLVETHCGLQVDEARGGALAAAIRTRMQQLGSRSPEAYVERLQSARSDEEFRRLLNLVTITETCFFRDPAQFRLLRHHILPTLVETRAAAGRRELRIWSAGCSSGEEAYSIALTLCEMGLPATHRDWRFEIVGTDLNTEMLDRAREGLYRVRALRLVPDEIRTRYFRPEGAGFRLHDEIRRMVRFEVGNLADEALPAPGELDLVFCKHVAIYFRPDAVQRLVDRLWETLADGGYLVLGPAESLWSVAHRFTLVEYDGAFCYRKGAGPTASAAARSRGHQCSPRPLARAARPAGEAAALAPAGEPETQYERCRAAFQAGAWHTAEAGLAALLHHRPDFVPARLLLGGLYAQSGRYDEALAQAEAILECDDLDARAALLVGMIEARRGRTDEALRSLRRALYLDEALVLGHFWLANLYRDRGDWERARLEYAHVIDRYARRAFDLTEEFASDLTIEQLVDYCRRVLATQG